LRFLPSDFLFPPSTSYSFPLLPNPPTLTHDTLVVSPSFFFLSYFFARFGVFCGNLPIAFDTEAVSAGPPSTAVLCPYSRPPRIFVHPLSALFFSPPQLSNPFFAPSPFFFVLLVQTTDCSRSIPLFCALFPTIRLSSSCPLLCVRRFGNQTPLAFLFFFFFFCPPSFFVAGVLNTSILRAACGCASFLPCFPHLPPPEAGIVAWFFVYFFSFFFTPPPGWPLRLVFRSIPFFWLHLNLPVNCWF